MLPNLRTLVAVCSFVFVGTDTRAGMVGHVYNANLLKVLLVTHYGIRGSRLPGHSSRPCSSFDKYICQGRGHKSYKNAEPSVFYFPVVTPTGILTRVTEKTSDTFAFTFFPLSSLVTLNGINKRNEKRETYPICQMEFTQISFPTVITDARPGKEHTFRVETTTNGNTMDWSFKYSFNFEN